MIKLRSVALVVFVVCASGLQPRAQTGPRLGWDQGSLSTVVGFAVTIDGVRTVHGRTPVAADGTCGCSIPVPFSGGRHTVTVSAYNATGETASAPMTVAPSAHAGGPYAGPVGSPIAVSGAGSVAPTGWLVSYRWKWGDGTSDTTSASAQASHVYATAGSYQLTLTVTDNAGATATATATSSVTIASSGLPSEWTQQDVGSVGLAGSASYSNGRFTVNGAGADIWETSDSFNYVYRSLPGDGQIVTRLNGMQNTHQFAKAGVMIRESLSPGSPHALLNLLPSGEVHLLARATPGALTTVPAASSQPLPAWLKLVRSGTSIVASVSADGKSWSVVGSTNITMTSNVLIGLVVCSHVTGALNTATFDNVAVSVTAAGSPPSTPTSPTPASGATGVSTAAGLGWSAPGASTYDVRFGATNPPPLVATGRTSASYQPSSLTGGATYYWQIVARNSAGSTTGPVWSFTTASSAGGALPAPWQNVDVGTSWGGGASFSSGTFRITGAGHNIWSRADGFHYVYRGLAGDGTIVARISDFAGTHEFAKAGLMIRASLDADAAHVVLDLRPTGDIEFMTRPKLGSLTTYLASSSQSPPTWLKLVRLGDTVTGFVSRDGAAWTQVGSTETWLPAAAYVGLIVSSHDDATLETAIFDSVSVSAGGTSPVLPSSSGDIVIYASDIDPKATHGSWETSSDPRSPNEVKLRTTDQGLAEVNAPLASPKHYIDANFIADPGKSYRVWLRLRATGNDKYNDSVWVQFSDALIGETPAYRVNSTSGLLVNLATDGNAGSLWIWGWAGDAYWLSQPTKVTFASGGMHTIRVQIREDGVQLDQIVLSPAQYMDAAPGSATNDQTIVPR